MEVKQNITVHESRSASLSCYSPIAHVVWYFSNSFTNSRRVFFRSDVDDSFMNSVTSSVGGGYVNLTFSNLTMNDTGTYTCTEILKPVKLSTIYLHVIGKEYVKIGSVLSTVGDEEYVTIGSVPSTVGDIGVNPTAGYNVAITSSVIVLIVLLIAAIMGYFYFKHRQRHNTSPKSGVTESSKNSTQPLATDEHNHLLETVMSSGNESNEALLSSGCSLRLLAELQKKPNESCCFSELNGIYCMVDQCGNLTIYRHTLKDNVGLTFEKLDYFPSDKPFTPSGFTASRKNNCFYVGNRVERCVHRITVNVEEKNRAVDMFIRSLDEQTGYPKSLSAMSDGRLAVLVVYENPISDEWTGSINIYLADSSLQLTVNPPNNTVDPWCVVYTGIEHGYDTFALTYRSCTSSGVIRLDSNDCILAHKTRLSIVCGIKYDKLNKSVYVTDGSNCQLLQMDLSLENMSVIHDWRDQSVETVSDNNRPIRMTLNAAKNEMLVGFASGCIRLYSFVRPDTM